MATSSGLSTADMQERINHLQRLIVLHSYIYYELDDNVISDHEYNELGHELAEYKQQYPDLWKNSMYYEQFGDEYDGSSGYDIYRKLSDEQKKIIQFIAEYRPRNHQ